LFSSSDAASGKNGPGILLAGAVYHFSYEAECLIPATFIDARTDDPTQRGSGALFETHFVDQDLVSFVECSVHYQKMDLDRFLAAVSLMLREDLRAIPFGFSGQRHYALADAVRQFAADQRGLPMENEHAL
jgi:hypothetical protein